MVAGPSIDCDTRSIFDARMAVQIVYSASMPLPTAASGFGQRVQGCHFEWMHVCMGTVGAHGMGIGCSLLELTMELEVTGTATGYAALQQGRRQRQSLAVYLCAPHCMMHSTV